MSDESLEVKLAELKLRNAVLAVKVSMSEILSSIGTSDFSFYSRIVGQIEPVFDGAYMGFTNYGNLDSAVAAGMSETVVVRFFNVWQSFYSTVAACIVRSLIPSAHKFFMAKEEALARPKQGIPHPLEKTADLLEANTLIQYFEFAVSLYKRASEISSVMENANVTDQLGTTEGISTCIAVSSLNSLQLQEAINGAERGGRTPVSLYSHN